MAIDLHNIEAGIGGFFIRGESLNFGSFGGGAQSVSAGDINGDGFDDLIIGAPERDHLFPTVENVGATYVVFGGPGVTSTVDLGSVAAGSGGFIIRGQDPQDRSGWSVSAAGDINADGFDDLIIGVFDGDGPDNTRFSAGESYVVFGHAGGFPASIDLAAVAAGNGGFVIYGEDQLDRSGHSVAIAGDVNGDGFDDLIVGAYLGERPTLFGDLHVDSGESYLVFGHAGGFSVGLNAVSSGYGGFVIHGQEPGDASGWSVASAGDVNGDGFDDLIIGAIAANGPGNARHYAGDSYVVFGHPGNFSAAIELAAVAAGNGGFVIHGQDALDRSGWSVSSAGDLNGDGFDDLVIGAIDADGPSNSRNLAGDTYVVFGAATFAAEIDLAAVATGAGGFVVHGENTDDRSGRSVASAGDVNGDGFDDIIIGARDAGGPAINTSGASYVVFGKAGGFAAEIDLRDIALGNGGFTIGRANYAGYGVSSAGDVNGDGFDDLIVGAPRYASDRGGAYVIFGSATIDGSANHVTHPGTAASETLTGDSSANVMIGGRGNDILIGDGGADVLRGGEGNDVLSIGDPTFLRVVGGAGYDTLAFAHGITLTDADFRRVESIESIQLGNGTTNLTLGPIASLAIDGLAAGSFQIAIDGTLVTNGAVTVSGAGLNRGLSIDLSNNVFAATLTGGAGNDVFKGGAGGDTLIGGPGSDTVSYAGSAAVSVNLATNTASGGRAAGDVISGIENLIGTASADTLIGDGNANTIEGGGGADALDGAGGSDTLSYAGSAAAVTVNLAANTASGGDAAGDAFSGFENLIGSASGDNLTGDGNANSIAGVAGNDNIDGGAGADTMVGGLGDDQYFVDNAGDVLFELAAQGYDVVRASVSYALTPGAEIEAFTTTNHGGTAAINLTGNEFGQYLLGNDGANILDGKAGADRLEGRFGDDQYFVDNADVLVELAGQGYDVVRASANYALTPGAEIEAITTTDHSGTAAINLTGNEFGTLAARQYLLGNDGSNILDGAGGADRMEGRLGNDTYLVDNADDLVVELAGQGYDIVRANVSYSLGAGTEIEELTVSGSAAFNLTGNEFGQFILGNDGANSIDGAGGADRMQGRLGDDQYFVDNAGDVLVETAGQGYDVVRASASYTLTAGAEIEAFTTTNHSGTAAINLTGNEFGQYILGNDGANNLDGKAGADRLEGRFGDDQYFVDTVGDVLVELAGQGYDVVRASINYALTAGAEIEALTTTDHSGTAAINLTGNEFGTLAARQYLLGNDGNNILDGAGGADRMEGRLGNDTYFVDNAGDLVVETAGQGFDAVRTSISYSLGAGAEIESFSTANNTGTATIHLTGNEFDQFILGNDGNNNIDGAGGADTMQGRLGDDQYFVDNAGDVLVELAGQGYDVVRTSLSFTLTGGAEIEALTTTNHSGTAAINLTGNEFGQYILGNDGNNTLDGKAGADRMEGRLGDDQYFVDNAGDVVVELAGQGFDVVRASASYTLNAGAVVEAITTTDHNGTAAIDLTGNEFDQIVMGNDGANTINGGSGRDTLTGGGGADAFLFNTALSVSNNFDSIIDYAVGVDQIQLDNSVFTGLADGALAAGAFAHGTSAAEADDRIIYDDSTGRLFFDADGVGGVDAVAFAGVGIGRPISASDFLVV